MEAMHLVHTPHTTDLMAPSDAALEAFFATAGLTVEVVARCNTAGCPLCFTEEPAKAA